MKVNPIKPDLISRIFKNKYVLNGLEKISEHSTSFSAGTSLIMTVGVRPLSIQLTPNVEKENKQYAIANSMSSGLIKFAMVEAIAIPLEAAVKNIDKNAEKFLKKDTIKTLMGASNTINNSKSYKMLTQIIKLSAGLITAIPKSMLTVALIPILMDKILLNDKSKDKKEEKIKHTNNYFNPIENKDIFFTGLMSDKISKGIGKIIDNKKLQNLAIKYQDLDKDVAKYMSMGTDILLTTSACQQTATSKKINENRKKALIYNDIISTGITLIGGYKLDNWVKTKSQGLLNRFKQANIYNPKLTKYVEGINILRPALIFAFIYYGILPIFSTYMAEKIDKYLIGKKDNK